MNKYFWSGRTLVYLVQGSRFEIFWTDQSAPGEVANSVAFSHINIKHV
jgi:hypothetical protein